jgi:small subunit ribosomal protein S8
MVRLATNVTDPIADFLTRIRNANLSFKDELHVPASNMNDALVRILEREGYIEGSEPDGDGVDRSIKVQLKYGRDRQRTITGLRRVSRPGRRVYVKRDRLPRVMGGLGVAILSTSQGLMTDRDAARAGLGGEVLAYVW